MFLTKIATNKGPFYQLGFNTGGGFSAFIDPNLASNQWTHIAVNFQKNEPPFFKRLFINGRWRSAGPDQPTKWRPLPLSGWLLLIGRGFDGAIDGIRVSNTVRYQDNFLPPNRRFEPDEHTMVLWHFDGKGEAVFEDSSANGNKLSIGIKEQLAWHTKSPMPTPRTEMSAIALGKKIYVFGGFDFNNNSFKATEIYNSETDSWSLGVPMPEHVNHAGIGDEKNGNYQIVLTLKTVLWIRPIN